MLPPRLFFGWIVTLLAAGQPAQAEIPVAIPVPVARVVPDSEAVLLAAPQLRQDLRHLPLSATIVTADFLESAMMRQVGDAAMHVPNALVTEFSTRKLSQPRFRGLGSSALNPGISTVVDGVPQFSPLSSNLEWLDLEQVDFLRGPLGTLFGRHATGGQIHLSSRSPSLTHSRGEWQATVGNYQTMDLRGSYSTPLIQDQLGFSLAAGSSQRDGFTREVTTGQDIDDRQAVFGKAQLLWRPDEDWEVRFILAGEHSKDGDYAFQDLATLRQNPRTAARDVSGHISRELIMPTLHIVYHAQGFDVSSITGWVNAESTELTDLDYLPFPLGIRHQVETQRTWTQEFRFANPADAPIHLSPNLDLRWQAGIMLFHTEHQQEAAHALVPPLSAAPVTTFSQSAIMGVGAGSYVQATLTVAQRLDITAGLRLDFESQDADLRSQNLPALATATQVDATREFTQLTPQLAISYRLNPSLMLYASWAGGYKAGGFNNTGPMAYGEETSWNHEIGIKGRTWQDKLSFSLAAFYTDWENLQLYQPVSPGQFFITNVGDATSRGLELELDFQCHRWLHIVASAGWNDTRFLGHARENGNALGGRQIPFTPDYTTSLGIHVEVPVTAHLQLYARTDLQTIGSFHYDAANTAAQDAYTLAHARVGLRRGLWYAEAFVNNALGTDYIPVAMSYPGLSPSGFIGESGAPTTFGLRLGMRF